MKIYPFTKTYDGECVLDFPGAETEGGRIYAVIGANGSGKSTFAKILAGIIPSDTKSKPSDARKTGYMPQKNFPFRMSTKANILLGGKDEKEALRLMDELGIRHLEAKRADKLSGGECARMALARLMMQSAELVILDEPTAAMDMESSVLAEKLIYEYTKKTGCALILITHSLRQAQRLADEVFFFHKGKLCEYGEKEAVLNSPENEQTRKFLDYYGA